MLKFLWCLDVHINANGVGVTTDEELDLLRWRQVAGMGQPCLERLLVLVDIALERKTCQIQQVVDADGRTEALLPCLAQIFELWPCKCTRVAFQHIVPMLGNTGLME